MLPANGNVVAWQEAVIGPEIANYRITEVRVQVGDTVKKGQVLARIANDTVYGLAGGVWSNDEEHAKRVARRVRALEESDKYPRVNFFADVLNSDMLDEKFLQRAPSWRRAACSGPPRPGV